MPRGNEPVVFSTNLVSSTTMRKKLLHELKILQVLQEGDNVINKFKGKDLQNLQILNQEGIIYYNLWTQQNWCLCIPTSLIDTVLKFTHEQLGYVGNN